MSTDQKIKEKMPNVIWIDPNIDNEENTKYIKELQDINFFNIRYFKNVVDAITLIKSIRFIETNIIISGSLYTEFVERFKENIKDIFIIPKIIIFTLNKEKFLENYQNINSNSFFNLGGIQTSFKKIKEFLFTPLNKKDIEEENQLTFEYIDCKEKLVLPLFYKTLIDLTPKDNVEKYTEYLYNKYSTNEEINNLLKSILNIPDIPLELLSKYYTRLYTIQSQFYYDINKELRENKKDNYLSFIKILYEGIKLKSLPLASNNILYRGSKISNNEINLIKKYLKEKLKDLPGAIVFSKSFLSFTKDKNIANGFLNLKNNNNNLSKVLYIIEKDDKIDYSLSTHSDIEDISFYGYEKEVLFFPFSSFEIKDIKESIYNNEKIYEIKLLYLGKYLKEVENLDTNIPDSKFKTEIKRLIPENKMTNAKEIIDNFKEQKRIIYNEIDINSNEINIIYNINNENAIKIFGKNFVGNNINKCKIVFNDKEYNLMEYFNIDNNIASNQLNKLKIKLRNINNITNMSHMFDGCKSLSSIPDIYNWNTINVTDMSYLFSECKLLLSLPDISKLNTINVTDMSYMFSDCTSLSTLPDISNWNTINVKNMSDMFYKCSSLKALPDISKWNTKNVTKMSFIFNECTSLTSIPDISKWNTNNVCNMSHMFWGCKSLISLPDLSKWNTTNVTNRSGMFHGCSLLKSLPNIS